MKATLRGTELYFDVAGMQLVPQGKRWVERPVMFLLHGGPGSDHLRYKLHSLELQDCAQLVFIDHRGCGRSKKTRERDYTLEKNIEDIEALRRYLGLDRIVLLGTSYGGVVAQGYAIRYPQHVSQLILVATAPSYRFIEEAKHNLQQWGTARQIAVCERLWNGSFTNARQVADFFAVMEPLYSVTAHTKRMPVIKPSTVYSYEALNRGFSTFMRSFDFIAQLKRIVCPTLVLAGKRDWICPPSQAKVLAQHLPKAQLQVFNNCGHAMAIDAHKRYISAIKKFLKTYSKA